MLLRVTIISTNMYLICDKYSFGIIFCITQLSPNSIFILQIRNTDDRGMRHLIQEQLINKCNYWDSNLSHLRNLLCLRLY